MNKKVLILFGSLSGSTADTAVVIGDEFREAGFSVTECDVRDFSNLDGFSGVIIGSPVMAGMLNGRVTRFMKRNRKKLKMLPTSLFVSCGALNEPSEKNQLYAESYLAKMKQIIPDLSPVSTAVFSGVLKTEGEIFNRAPFIMKKIVTSIASSQPSQIQNFDSVKIWARESAKQFSERVKG